MNIQEKMRELSSGQLPIQLHLGCGKRVLPNFLHIDMDSFDHLDHQGDISDLSVIPTGSCDLIYACHCLEYFDFIQVKDVLAEWSRVLKPGGTLRVSVPDFQKVINIYQKEGKLDLLYGFLYGRYTANKETADCIYHRMIFDHKSLEKYFKEVGLGNFRLYDWKETIHKDFDDYSQAYLPHMDKENGILMSLNVEGDKL